MLLTAFTWPFPPTLPNILKQNKNTSNGILSFVFNLAPACSFGSEERVSVCTRMQSLPLQSYKRIGGKKKPHNLWILMLELCFGLPLMLLPLDTAVSRAVGPLGEAGLVTVLLVGIRKEAAPQP